MHDVTKSFMDPPEVALDVTGLLLTVLNLSDSPRARRISQAIGGALVVYKGVSQLVHRSEKIYTVAIKSGDLVYSDLHRWILDQMSSTDRRSLIVSSCDNSLFGESAESKSSDESEGSLSMHHDGTNAVTFDLAGESIMVEVEPINGHRSERLLFTVRTPTARDAVLDVIKGLSATYFQTRKPQMFMPGRFEDWDSSSSLSLRSLDTVILRAGQQEALVADLRRFLDSEERYSRLNLPWHRGYLFHGPPGTGKSSLARSLASHFDLDIYYLPLSDLKSDSNLLDLIGAVPARSVLLLEDIDVVHAATSRDDENGRASLSSLLNALDGLLTPHGLITIMTTNHLDALDPALLRFGRMDRTEEFGYLDDDSLGRLAYLVLGEHLDLEPLTRADMSAAEVLETIKGYLDVPDQIPGVLKDFLHQHSLRAAA